MEKDTEQEIIPIALSAEQKKLFAKRLAKNINCMPMDAKIRMPQFKFIQSVHRKLKKKSALPMLFNARECATMSGWLTAHIQDTKDERFAAIHDIIERALREWANKGADVN